MADQFTANDEFSYSNVSSITTDFNVNPYYDDFDDDKNYYRILFKPGFPVQSREVTQIQSMLQDQIQKFGQHMFKEGSMVVGGKFSIDTRAHYVKVNDKDINGADVDISIFKDQIVTGQTTGIQAYVNIALDGAEGTDNPKTLYVSYLTANPDTDETYFTANEPLIANVGTLIVGNNVPVGYGSVFTINEGVRFAKQHFIKHSKQYVVIDRYDINPTCKVGFTLIESIVTAAEDTTLLDPAQESSNYAAPGADRFKITPVLTRLDYDDPAAFPDFVTLFMIKDNVVTEVAERPTYNVIRDEIAKRTYDESGDYYVKGFNVVVEEHLNTGTNNGYLTLDRGGDASKLSVQVEPGTAYVKGYEVNKLVTEFLETDKSTEYANISGQIVSTKLGSYILVKEAVGAWNVNVGQTVDLYDTAQQRITNAIGATSAATGSKIGTAKIKSIAHESGLIGTRSGVLRVYLFDIAMTGTNSFANVKSLYLSNPSTSNIVGDVVLTLNNKCVLRDAGAPLLYYVGTDHAKTLRTPTGAVDTSFMFKKTSDISIVSDGSFTLSSPVATEIFPYGTTSLASADKRDIFLTVNQQVSIALSGTASGGAGTNTALGSAGSKYTYLNVGDKISVSGNSTIYTVTAINTDTSMVVDKLLPATYSGNTLSKVYLAGDMIDLTSKNATTGTERTVTASPSSVSVALGETFGSPVSATVTYTLARTSAREIKKTLKPSRFVKIDCSTAGTTGPFDLGFSDVYRIKNIWKKSSAFTTEDPATETGVTQATFSFGFDNGQRDDSYGHARIVPYTTLNASDKYLVELDYFQPEYTLGVGYFSVDSYPINDVNPSSSELRTVEIPFYVSTSYGYSIDLRNHIDFRPVYVNTAADSTTIAGASVNPSTTTTLQYESAGLRLPADSEPMSFDYSSYFARIDIVAIDSRGQFKIIKGTPASTPVTPLCPQNLMSLARVYVPPYPSLSINYGRKTGRNDLTCSVRRTSQVRFTMKDIGVLKQRVDNIENYVSLSLLEKSAVDMKILDEYGLDRFKNGIFVDSFTSFITSDVTNPDHHICYDPKEGSIRPLNESHAIGYDFKSGTNVTKVGNIVMLPYTEVVAAQQPFATTIRNVETTVYRFVGKLYLDPDSDYWVNTNRLASQTFRFGATDEDVTPYSIVYGSWQTTVTGVTTTDPKMISSATSSATTTSSSTSATAAQTIRVHPTGVASINSLIQQYGGDVPCTMYGINSGHNFYNGPLSGVIAQIQYYYNREKRPGETIDQYINTVFTDVVIGKSAGTQTTTTKTETITSTNTFQTTTTTSSQASRAFTETFQTLQTETQSIGDKVLAVAPIADIRPQTIAFEGRGVKAGTKHYVFFDGQLMSEYVTPATMISTSMQATGTSANLLTITGNEGAPLYSDNRGFVYGLLRLPADSAKSFRTGTKEVVVTDSLTNEPDATSVAVAYFAAQGVTQTVQETIISTGTIVTSTKNGIEKGPVTVSNTTNTYTTSASYTGNVTNTTTTTAKVTMDFQNVSCMAYSFKLNSRYGDEGVFLSSVDVFFSAKDPNLGVWFEIRAMDNSGNITQTQVPGSEVWMLSSDVNTSSDGSVPTNVKFKTPIFLMNNVEYALIVHTVGINPNYYMFVSVLGQKDLLTNKLVTSRPLTGTLFTTNNNTDWDIVPRVDLKVTFNRAKFQTGVVGEAILGNQGREFVSLPDPIRSGANTSWFGERIFGSDELTLSTPTNGYTITVGDQIVGSNSSVTANVTTKVGNKCGMDKTGYEEGETCSIKKANGYSVPSVTCSVVTKNTPEGKIYTSKVKLQTSNTCNLVITNSNGLFIPNTNMFGQYSANVVSGASINDFTYSSIQFEPSHLVFLPTDCIFSMSTTTKALTQTEYQQIAHSSVIEYDYENDILSRSREIALLNGDSSNKVKVLMSTNSDYLSPIVNLDKTYTVYVNNLINSNTANELAPRGGALKNKYISQVITLADGQDAEDLRVILTAYRPSSSNAEIKVYVRISHAEDFESIYNRPWIEMKQLNPSAYSSLAHRKDFREFQYEFPESVMTGENDQGAKIVGYTNSVGTQFETFKQYQIKIGLQSDNSAIYPRVADLRCIALQK